MKQCKNMFLLNKSRSSCFFLSKLKICLIRNPDPQAKKVGRKPDRPVSENVRIPGGRRGGGGMVRLGIDWYILGWRLKESPLAENHLIQFASWSTLVYYNAVSVWCKMTGVTSHQNWTSIAQWTEAPVCSFTILYQWLQVAGSEPGFWEAQVHVSSDLFSFNPCWQNLQNIICNSAERERLLKWTVHIAEFTPGKIAWCYFSHRLRIDMMMFRKLHRLVNKLFRLSAKLDPVYQIIILSYYSQFCSCSRNHTIK